jgi:hypothetical protein
MSGPTKLKPGIVPVNSPVVVGNKATSVSC